MKIRGFRNIEAATTVDRFVQQTLDNCCIHLHVKEGSFGKAFLLCTFNRVIYYTYDPFEAFNFLNNKVPISYLSEVV